jgi:hypothetical protein
LAVKRSTVVLLRPYPLATEAQPPMMHVLFGLFLYWIFSREFMVADCE